MKSLLVIPLLLLLSVPVSAWNWETHRALVEAFYYSVDDETQQRLNITALQEGSIAPDKVFRDFRRHSYPYSLERMLYWLDKMRNARDATERGYAFGVAAHYLADSFSAPHNVVGEKYQDHRQYEDQASEDYVYVACANRSYDLAEELKAATEEGDTWQDWLHTQNKEYPQEAVADAMDLVYAVGLHEFSASCRDLTTIVERRGWFAGLFVGRNVVDLVVFFGCGALIVVVLFSLKKDLKDCAEQLDEPVDDTLEE